MNRDNAELIAILIDKITKIENVLFKLDELKASDSFIIRGFKGDKDHSSVELPFNEVTTAVFSQDIIQLYVDTLNLELSELIKKLEEDF